MKYRHNWLRCIHRFESVYRTDPDGPWAPAGLYMAGTLYAELYEHSFLSADRREAVDIFQRIGKRFPKSAYRKKADAVLAKMAESKPADRKEEKAGARKSQGGDGPGAASPRELYARAEACYRDLKNDSRAQKYRDHWKRCIDGFDAVYRYDTSGPWAAAGLYMSGVLYEGLSRHSFSEQDTKEALKRFRRVVADHPKSRYRAKARAEIERIDGAEEAQDNGVAEIIASHSAGTAAPALPAAPAQKPAPDHDGRILVTGLRYWSNPSYTRVVVDADGDTGFTHRLLKADPSIEKPPRLFVDLTGAVLDKDLDKTVPINDDLLSDIRAGQYTPETVRVVIDIKSFKNYKIFSLKNPFRIVIDVWGESSATAEKAPSNRAGSAAKLPSNALAKQLALGVSRIVIDPGHGGRDYGAPGYLKGVHEKDLALQISKRLAKEIRSQLGCEVILTRTDDRYLTLEERTALANTKNADLFISIHTNSHRDRRAHGVETYFLNLATDNESIVVAATENATSEKNISDLQTILLDLMQNAKINESSRLAAHVQKEICTNLKSHYSLVKDKGVKQAPFYVLLGAQMPSILVETSFISNARECKRLVTAKYQERICRGIIAGIRDYIRENQPTAFRSPAPPQDARGG